MMVVLVILFMVMGSFGAGAIAKAKNRDYRSWFALGLVFPVPALIAASLVRAKTSEEMY